MVIFVFSETEKYGWKQFLILPKGSIWKSEESEQI